MKKRKIHGLMSLSREDNLSEEHEDLAENSCSRWNADRRGNLYGNASIKYNNRLSDFIRIHDENIKRKRVLDVENVGVRQLCLSTESGMG